jgi:PAS domain S-box-containing protein
VADGSNQDVEERPEKPVDRPLGAGELSFAAIANSIDQMIWSTRPDGYHDYYNERWYEYTGVPPGWTDGEAWNAMFHPDDRERAWSTWRRSLATGEPYHIEYRLRHRSGDYRWVIGRAQCVCGGDGQISRWYGTCTDVHDLKCAQEQIRRNHDTFYNLIQNNPFGIYVIDADFRIAEASQGSQKVFKNVVPLIGQDFAEVLRVVWAEPFASEAIERFWHTLRTGEPYSSPRTVQPRGDIDALEAYDWRIERIELPDGRYGVVCYFYDLSERQRWEAALGAASERIELALDAGAVAGTWVWEIPNDNFTADERFAKSFGLDAEMCKLGIPLAEAVTAIHPDDLARVAGLIDTTLKTGGEYRAEYRVRQSDGLYHWVEAVGRCDLDELGQPLRFPGVIVDIDARKRDESALRESEARLRTLTDNLPGGMVYQVSTGVDGSERRFLYVSQSHEKLTGVPAEEVLRDPAVAYNMILPEFRERLASGEAEAIALRKTFDEEVQFRRADGELRWCRIISEPRPQSDGSIIWDGIQIDITEQKIAELRMGELNASLEARVSERAAELAHAQEALRQSQKLESMGQLTGGVAHDFNNLLTPIIGGLDLLQRRNVGDERAQRTIEGALASAERAKVLVQRLLAFARRQPLQPSAVDIRGLVLSMAGLLESTLGPRIILELHLPEHLPCAKADPNQLEMALLNLVLNSRDAMSEGGTVRIDARCVTAARGTFLCDFVELSVADTGIGMDEQTVARAVEPFFSTKGIGRGTGLGLSMVHGLQAQLGGELLVESKPGHGTTIKLRFETVEFPAAKANAPVEVSAHSGGGTVLLVDDEDLVRASTAEMLSDMGYLVLQESSAESALLRLSEGLGPAILVTDHLMPGMTGTELARAARKVLPQLPVLIISGYADLEGIADDLPRLTKPFRQAELESHIAAMQTAG